MNIGFLVSVLLSFPVMFFGARNNFIALMKIIFIKNDPKKSEGAWRENGDNIEQISSYIQSTNR